MVVRKFKVSISIWKSFKGKDGTCQGEVTKEPKWRRFQSLFSEIYLFFSFLKDVCKEERKKMCKKHVSIF